MAREKENKALVARVKKNGMALGNHHKKVSNDQLKLTPALRMV
jgi:hypothetical protein